MLHLSEPETNLRLVVARATRRHPIVLEMLREGRLHLSGIALLSPQLTEENRETILARATHCSRRRIEELVAELAPRPDVAATIRRLPDTAGAHLPSDPRATARPCPPAGMQAPAGLHPSAGPLPPPITASAANTLASPCSGEPASRPDETHGHRKLPGGRRASALEPLAPERYRVQFTASRALRDKLERLASLLRSSIRDGDLAAIVEDAVTERIARLEARRLAAARRPRKALADSDTGPGSRSIPAAVKRTVRRRDGDRCAFVSRNGRRCSATSDLQFHHRHPHGCGGDRSPGNIALYCRPHNAYEAAADYGRHVADTHSG